MNIVKYIFLSIFIVFYFLGCGSSDASAKPTKRLTIKVAMPQPKNNKLSNSKQKPDVTIATVRLDVNSSEHIYMQNAIMSKIISKSGNYWMIVTKPLPIDISLSFVAKAYNGTETLIFRGSYYGAIADNISDITLPLVSDNIHIESRPSLSSIVFNNHEKTDITFNIYNPNEDRLNYQINSSSGTFSPNSGSLDFSSTLKFSSLHVSFNPTAQSSDCRFVLTNSDSEQFTTSFTIQTTPTPPSKIKLKALYSQDSKLYAIERNETVKLLNTDAQLIRNKNTISKPIFMNNYAYFSAFNESHGYEVWRSDGSQNGTSIIKDINPNNNTYSPIKLIRLGNKIYFGINDGIHGKELWSSDGTETNTVMVKDINPDGSSHPSNFVTVGDILYFSAYSNRSTDLWRSNGTANGTYMIKKINSNGNSDVYEITNVDNILYFRAKDSSDHLALWRSNGTSEGTYVVKSYPNSDFNIYRLKNLNGILYFARQNINNGIELWKSDGTNNGTQIIKVLNSSSNASMDTMIKMDNILYFSTKDRDSYEQLWRSDGTEDGTYPIADINPTYNYFSTPIVGLNHSIYFRAKDDYGYELWKSDGTEGGAIMVKDINPSGHSFPTYLTDIDNLLYFVANDGDGNDELWRSNGTEADTVKVTLPE